MSNIKALLIISLTIFIIFSCQKEKKANTEEITAALLKSNEIQRTAHLENNAQLLVSEIADTMISLQRGEISFASNQAIKARFERYFGQVKYNSWDDVREPIIEISSDGKSASVNFQKFLDLQSRSEEGELGKNNYGLFAWNSQYKLIDNQWKITAITSTDKPLTEEEALNLRINFSAFYVEIKEPDLIPEGIAHNNQSGTTYISSTYKQKIIAVQKDGTYFDFKKEQEDGLWSTVGMEVDEINNILWVISFNGHEVLPMKYPDSTAEWKSKIYAYKLPEGELIDIYEPKITGKFAFNDLCVAKNGRVFITESLNNQVYQLDPASGNFTQLEIQDSLFVFPNGITTSEESKYLYIASSAGIFQYNLQDKTYRKLAHQKGIIPNRIDGLAYHKGSLIANQPYRKRILQFVLDEENGQITSQRILEANHPDFDQPSTGEISGDQFIYLANAQMRSGFEKGVLRPIGELESVKLLKVNLTPIFTSD